MLVSKPPPLSYSKSTSFARSHRHNSARYNGGGHSEVLGSFLDLLSDEIFLKVDCLGGKTGAHMQVCMHTHGVIIISSQTCTNPRLAGAAIVGDHRVTHIRALVIRLLCIFLLLGRKSTEAELLWKSD